MAGLSQDNSMAGIPTGQGAPPQCPDCFCAPHRNAAPERDKVCARCGCPTFRQAKAVRDADASAMHGDSSRPSEGFS